MLKFVKKQATLGRLSSLVNSSTDVLKIINMKIMTADVLQKNYLKFHKLDKKYKKIGKIRNICFLSGRLRGNYRYFKLSRMFIRELGNAGFFMGMRKTSF
jgi:ribosomal protein S14